MAGSLDELISSALSASIEVNRSLIATEVGAIAAAAELLVTAISGGKKILAAGNGGSAAEAQHVAAELVGRFLSERPALPAIALTTDTSVLTSLLNDYGPEAVFRRQVEALAAPGDVLLVLSTSGDSPNVVAAVAAAGDAGAKTIALTGSTGGALAGLCDVTVRVPSTDTPRIQEAHTVICHVLCQAVERAVTAS